MSQTDTNKSITKTKIIIVLLIAGTVLITGLLYRNTGENENIDQPVAEMPAAQIDMNKTKIMDEQKASDQAAISGKTVSGPVTKRPDYVSDIEWRTLKGVTETQPDQEKKLTNLVNKMLFIKKKQAWLSSAENTDQRRQLARELLDMIPGQLEIEAIDEQTAKELENKLDADLRAGAGEKTSAGQSGEGTNR